MNKKGFLLVNLIFGQVFVVGSLTYHHFLTVSGSPYANQLPDNAFSILLVISTLLGIAAVCIFHHIIGLSEREVKTKLAEQRLKDSEELIQVLRANQHDFINHLQVIYGAAKLGKIELVDEFCTSLIEEVKENGLIGQIPYPEIAALLYTKINKGEAIGAKVQVNVNTDLKHLSLPTMDLSRVLGNLLDNALYALEEIEIPRRELKIEIFEERDSFKFTVFNRYPIIPKEIQDKIFYPGFTTKGNNGSGLGLFNVRQIADKYQGKLTFRSEENWGTEFTISFNKQLS